MSAKAEVSGDLVEAARHGEPGALDRLLAQAWPHAFRIARSILHDEGLAEDAAQEACAIVYGGVARLRSAFAFRVWFYRIAVREAMRLDRKRAMLTFFATDPVASADPGESIELLDVRRALGRLSRVQRAAIVLHYYADMNSREIAAVLGIPSATVRFHLASARRKLEIMLGDARLPARLLEVVNGAH